MALISCPGCGRQISEYARSCPQCGFALIPDREAPAAVYPPEWPNDARRVLPWAGLYFGAGAALAFIIWWLIREPDLVPSWAALILASVGVASSAAGAVFRSRAALLAAAVTFLASALLGYPRNLAAAVLALLAVLPLAVFLLLELIRQLKNRKGVV